MFVSRMEWARGPGDVVMAFLYVLSRENPLAIFRACSQCPCLCIFYKQKSVHLLIDDVPIVST
jgi:hypothetical protein